MVSIVHVDDSGVDTQHSSDAGAEEEERVEGVQQELLLVSDLQLATIIEPTWVTSEHTLSPFS